MGLLENKDRKVKIRILVGTIIAVLVLGGIGISVWASYNWLVVNEYKVSVEYIAGGKSLNEENSVGTETEMGKSEQVKIAVISDLHDHEFGTANEKLITKISEQSPDLIFLVGDILNEDSENANVPCELIEGLSAAAPVCFSLGNHEEMYREMHPEMVKELEAAGAKVLNKEYVDLDVGGIELRVGGMYDYAFGLNAENEASAAPEEIKKFLTEYQNTERLKIMLAHRPDSFIFGDASKVWDVDLVVSGHDHGGQVVLPFAGGLFGGDQGWFPEYIHGLCEKDGMKLLVTSGLGSNKQKLPRFNNPPEIMIVTITK